MIFDVNILLDEIVVFLKEYYIIELMEVELIDFNIVIYFFKNEEGEVVGFLKFFWKDV